MSKNSPEDLIERLKFSLDTGAVHGGTFHRAVCEAQIKEAALTIEKLLGYISTMSAKIQTLVEGTEEAAAIIERLLEDRERMIHQIEALMESLMFREPANEPDSEGDV